MILILVVSCHTFWAQVGAHVILRVKRASKKGLPLPSPHIIDFVLNHTPPPPLSFQFSACGVGSCRSNMHTTINERCTYHQQH